NQGQSVTWIAPATAGTYTITVTVDDEDNCGGGGCGGDICGSDNDSSKHDDFEITVMQVAIDTPASFPAYVCLDGNLGLSCTVLAPGGEAPIFAGY
ncbi:MAG: hypothetical protein J7M08_07275, partial [Planctomycetes bacterium]|nr:hypothetical protein [Planctomycetota bacterium]